MNAYYFSATEHFEATGIFLYIKAKFECPLFFFYKLCFDLGYHTYHGKILLMSFIFHLYFILPVTFRQVAIYFKLR